MYLAQLFSLLCRAFNRKRRLALAPVPVRKITRVVLAIAILSLGHNALALVSFTGNYSPADNPFPLPDLTNPDEGMPSDGNIVKTSEPADHQTFFEGRHSDGANPNIITDDTNINFAVVIGQTSKGTLTLDSTAALRDEDLVIGSAAKLNGVNSKGIGEVLITGFGSVYNNNPAIIPSGLPDNFKSVNPRTTDDTNGFDLYIGTSTSVGGRHIFGTGVTVADQGIGGKGTLTIQSGGRAEIEDSVVLGEVVGSAGTINVDGEDSFLGSGGFSTNQASVTDPHSMIIGKQGIGTLNITNGGTVSTIASQAPAPGGGANVAASIGDSAFVFGATQSVPGGSGKVTVDGFSSSWSVAGTLQVGGFTDVRQGSTTTGVTDTDLDGINSSLFYNTRAGQGSLYVQNGGSVNISLQPGISPTQNPPLYLAIGQNGLVQLAGGTINIGEVDSTGQNSRGDRSQVVNDGTITGSGTIITGVFRNRYLGRVVVSSGQSMTIYASSFLPASSTATTIQPWNNWGSIQVLGNDQAPAILDFERQSIPSTQNPPAPFLNLSVVQPVGIPDKVGIISCQSCVLRFGSGNAGQLLPLNGSSVIGLKNNGTLAFTGGSNYVTGNVLNAIADPALNTAAGNVAIFGSNTTVTFEEDFFDQAGTLNMSPGATLNILNRHSFAANGLKYTLDPQHLTTINSAGDVDITGFFNLTLSNFPANSLTLGSSFAIIHYSGDLNTLDMSNPNSPSINTKTSGKFTSSNLSSISLVPYGLDPTDHFHLDYSAPGIISLVIKAIGNASGPDFNGDGVVNTLDLQIWQQNVGTLSGATVLEGDANGDGRVDGQDFLIWQQHLGPYPGAGSGSGFANNAANVPEPTSVALVLMTGLAWLPLRRRHAG